MKQNILIGLLIIAIFATIGFIIKGTSSNTTSIESESAEVQKADTLPTSSEKVEIEDLVVGEGVEVKSGDTVVIHYKGMLEDGTQFDSSYDRGEPYETQIGVGTVIQGWDQGVPGMKVGGKRKLVIPAELGYGAQGNGSIPPNAPLIFEVELLEIK